MRIKLNLEYHDNQNSIVNFPFKTPKLIYSIKNVGSSTIYDLKKNIEFYIRNTIFCSTSPNFEVSQLDLEGFLLVDSENLISMLKENDIIK